MGIDVDEEEGSKAIKIPINIISIKEAVDISIIYYKYKRSS